MHRYLLFGLTVGSAIPLPELRLAPPDSPLDVTIEIGAVPDHLPAPLIHRPQVQTDQRYFLFQAPRIGRFLISDHDQITIQPNDTIVDHRLRHFLYGTVIRAVCERHGMLMLHGASLNYDGHGVALLARSGEGKSTISAFLRQRGWEVLSDDTCAIAFQQDVPWIHPGPAFIKLDDKSRTQLALDQLDSSPGKLTNQSKHWLTLDNPVGGMPPLRLEQVFLLASGAAFSIRRFHAQDAVKPLLRSRFNQAAHLAPQKHAGLKACATLARYPVSRLTRPRGYEYLADTATLLEQQLSRGTHAPW